MKESIKSIIAWHEQTFGDAATLAGQMQKFQDEKEEWHQSQRITPQGIIDGDIMELADMVIVAAGVARFSTLESIFMFRTIAEELGNSRFATSDLEKAVDTKMEIVRARKWTPQNGSFQHVEE